MAVCKDAWVRDPWSGPDEGKDGSPFSQDLLLIGSYKRWVDFFLALRGSPWLARWKTS